MLDQREVIVVLIALLGVYMMDKHRKPSYQGPFRDQPYPTMDPVLRDTAKFATLQLLTHFIYRTKKPFYNKKNLLDSRCGELMIILLSMMLYHHVILPYLVYDLNRVSTPVDTDELPINELEGSEEALEDSGEELSDEELIQEMEELSRPPQMAPPAPTMLSATPMTPTMTPLSPATPMAPPSMAPPSMAPHSMGASPTMMPPPMMSSEMGYPPSMGSSHSGYSMGPVNLM